MRLLSLLFASFSLSTLASAPVEIIEAGTSYTVPITEGQSTAFVASPAYEPMVQSNPADMGVVMIQDESTPFVPQPDVFVDTPPAMPQAASPMRPEELQNEVQRLSARVDELEQKIASMDQTLQDMAKGRSAPKPPIAEPMAPAPTMPEPAASPQPQPMAAELKHLSPEQAYESARAYITQTEYPKAQKALAEFVAAFPEHKLASAALYWMGETYFVEKNYKVAAQKFLEGYKKDPKGSKAADNLLKLSLCLDALGKSPEACTTLKKLFKEYPAMNGSIKAMAQRTRDRLQCKK